MRNENASVIRQPNYAAAIVVTLGFLAASLLFVFFVGLQSRQEILHHIITAVHQSQFNIDEHIAEQFQTIGTGRILSEEREWLADDASFARMVERLLLYNSYTRAGLASLEGDALWADKDGKRNRANLSGEEYIQKALGGENAISETHWDDVYATYVNDYAIPTYRADGTQSGALFVSDPVDELLAIMDNSLFSASGFAQIVTNDGAYVLQSKNPLHNADSRDVFDIPAALDPEVKQKVLEDATAGRSGHLHVGVGGENRIVAYTPSHYNDWYVMYSVQDDRVNAQVRNIAGAAMMVICISNIAFLFFLLLIRRSNRKSQRDLERLAFVDPLTGSRSLQKFMIDARKLLEKYPREGYAACYSDIKGLKYINTFFGRDTGDALLRHFMGILEKESGEDELCAHADGDRFVALCRLENQEITKQRYRAISEQMSSFPTVAAQGYKVEIYGGVYMVDPRDGDLPLEDMLDRALEAQQAVKRQGGGSRVGFYSNEMRAQKLWETEVESRMEQALQNGEFQMYLQPKIGIQHGDRIIGMEALVRWMPPGQETIPPGRFIGLFERNGFIIQLDLYMLEQACRAYRELGLAMLAPPPVLSVNVSRLSLQQTDIVQRYTDIRDAYGIPDGLMELEFTEGALFEDHGRFQDIVEQFRKNGFLCSLDDFGSGYSSLNALKSLRVDVLKLDRLFFHYGGDEARGREMVKSIVVLAKILKLQTIAEGIEEEAEVQWLRKIGCDAVQGYVFSKPLPVDKFMQFLDRWKEAGRHEP